MLLLLLPVSSVSPPHLESFFKVASSDDEQRCHSWICSCSSDETRGSPHSATPRHEQRLELPTGNFGMVTLAERSELQLALESDFARRGQYIWYESDACVSSFVLGEFCDCPRAEGSRLGSVVNWQCAAGCRHVKRVRRAVAPHHLFLVQTVHKMSCATHYRMSSLSSLFPDQKC